jgi:hypothetical protein
MHSDPISGSRSLWPRWANSLHQRGAGELVAWLLDAFGPALVIGAQILHAGSPFIQALIPQKYIEPVANLLEDPDEARAFAAFLREGRIL